MSERRSKKRWDVCLHASLVGGRRDGARVTDLSEGGCYIDSISGADVGEIITFKLELPGNEWLELRGEVAHQTPSLGFGVRFVDLTDEQRERLHSLIAPQNSDDPLRAT